MSDQTPREVFEALLAELKKGQQDLDGPPWDHWSEETWQIERAEWLARFDAAQPVEMLPVGITEREAEFVAAREGHWEAARDYVARRRRETAQAQPWCDACRSYHPPTTPCEAGER